MEMEDEASCDKVVNFDPRLEEMCVFRRSSPGT